MFQITIRIQIFLIWFSEGNTLCGKCDSEFLIETWLNVHKITQHHCRMQSMHFKYGPKSEFCISHGKHS